jgi:hypothetical protein
LSAKFENQTASSAAAKAPPPHSCTRARALNGAGVSARLAPSAPAATTTERPPSSGRPCSHSTRPPTMRGAPTGRTPAATRAAVMDERQVP